jgi:hypothetical protein
MRRLLVIWSAVGLLCGALGCHNCTHVGGKCDCDEMGYGCPSPLCSGHGAGSNYCAAVAPVPAPAGRQAETLKDMPKEVTPKDEGK